MERSFVMIKPDGVQRALIGATVSRFETKGLKLVAAKFMRISKELASEHYGEHMGKPFYDALITYITSGPVLAMVFEGNNAIACVRTLVGKTDPQEAAPGTIRGDLAMETGRNIIHASDSLESAAREIALFFKPDEIIQYERADEIWVYE